MADSYCGSGKYCVARTSTGPAVLARPGLCPRCIEDIEKCWAELPDYRMALMDFRVKSPSVGGEKVSGSSEPSTPINVRVLDLIDAIDEVLASGQGARIRDIVTWTDGIPLALRVRKLHSQADGVVGLGQVWERRRAPCPDCGLPTLGSWVGAGVVMCTNANCATTLTQSEYEDYCLRKARE
ncbi:hypothetical protein SEA_AEGEUS_90 [Mycobacterium phage Aegeus]|nr:hypothetical protein SEA_BAUDELAIRE_90 [Mycobacterium phage Baudelaire]WKW86582.1 hypothetical protein SEA_AEGEUS_90 [Mycobacterium phage Aegeus]